MTDSPSPHLTERVHCVETFINGYTYIAPKGNIGDLLLVRVKCKYLRVSSQLSRALASVRVEVGE